ncbi:GMC oxidoreductase [Ophiocordyceps camponoti-floridani]|uniref:GMC oxidoreductase n=1 Tax=Ophiocordyceps camponoti-floridani TaxID=2030778 RepID=A0A8H4QAZ7_9HYPO|nr:GMC oxidoreductase [Ophiocordyceps camponoti-floridani]
MMRACLVASLATVVSCSSTTPLPTSALGQAGAATYEYVVVGGGTAGLVIASRLAEAGRSVAVVEAGGFYEVDAGLSCRVPSYAVVGAGSSPDAVVPAVDWGFVTVPQRGLGGSSARNYFTYNRPTRDSLDKWATLPTTSVPQRLRPHPSPSSFAPDAGPLHVSFPTWANAFSSWAKLGWRELGFPDARDFVSGELSGVQYCQNTIDPRGQVRDTSFSAFLRTAVGKGAPVTVYNNTLAKRIVFEAKVARGVLVESGGGLEYVLSAKKEVILSAGVFQSPQLLMVSGVGPPETLTRHKIPIVASLPGVGRNMQDHIVVGTTYRVKTPTHSSVTNATVLRDSEAEWNATGSGILGNPGGELIAWERLTAESGKFSEGTGAVLSSVPGDFPTVEYLILDAYSGNNENYVTGAPDTPYMYASPVAAVHVPQSRGSVTISSPDTSIPPVIDPAWLTHAVDRELALYAFRRLRQLMDTRAVKPVWTSEVVPGRNVTSDAEILAVMGRNAIQEFHASYALAEKLSEDILKDL